MVKDMENTSYELTPLIRFIYLWVATNNACRYWLATNNACRFKQIQIYVSYSWNSRAETMKHNRPKSVKLLSNDRQAVGFVSS